MTTVIQPASGAAPLFTQQGTGTTPGYSALDDRRSNSGSLQEGVYGTSTLVTAGGVSNVANADFMVTQRNAGANLSVDINMPAGGFALVQGDTIAGQGLYGVPVHSATINEAVAAADPTNPRIDSVILEIQDNVIDGTAGNLARVRVLTGAPNGSATLSNRTGAPALPGSALLLADLVVPAASSSVPNSNIRDRRKWARGVHAKFIRTTGVSITNATTSLIAIDATNLQGRFEFSGMPIRLCLQSYGSNGTAGDGVAIAPFVDGAAVDGITTGWVFNNAGASVNSILVFDYVTTPAPGSHTVTPAFASAFGGTATIASAASTPVVFTVEEIVRQNTANNTVTSG